MAGFDPISLALVLAALALLPTLVVVSTSFLKVAVVMSLMRNALGVQQIPPNIAIYGLTLIITAYIMAPVGQNIYESVTATPEITRSVEKTFQAFTRGAEPVREFLYRHSDRDQRNFFVQAAKD